MAKKNTQEKKTIQSTLRVKDTNMSNTLKIQLEDSERFVLKGYSKEAENWEYLEGDQGFKVLLSPDHKTGISSQKFFEGEKILDVHFDISTMSNALKALDKNGHTHCKLQFIEVEDRGKLMILKPIRLLDTDPKINIFLAPKDENDNDKLIDEEE